MKRIPSQKNDITGETGYPNKKRKKRKENEPVREVQRIPTIKPHIKDSQVIPEKYCLTKNLKNKLILKLKVLL